MFKLDNNFLVELGLGELPAVEKNKMLAHIYETLEMRVGMKLAEQMSNEQLDEFESYINQQDEAGALKWLETNFPNYKQVVADELEKLKGEIKQVAPQIVAQAAQAAAAQPNPVPAVQTQPQQPGNPPAQQQPTTTAQPSTPPVPPQPSSAPAQQPSQPMQQPPVQPQPGMGQPMQPPQPTNPATSSQPPADQQTPTPQPPAQPAN